MFWAFIRDNENTYRNDTIRKGMGKQIVMVNRNLTIIIDVKTNWIQTNAFEKNEIGRFCFLFFRFESVLFI